MIVGNLSSTRSGFSNATAVDGFSFGSGAPATSNRRIELQLNLNYRRANLFEFR